MVLLAMTTTTDGSGGTRACASVERGSDSEHHAPPERGHLLHVVRGRASPVAGDEVLWRRYVRGAGACVCDAWTDRSRRTACCRAGSVLDIMRYKYKTGLEESVIATILREALKGLEYIHQSNQIHRYVRSCWVLLLSSTIDAYGQVPAEVRYRNRLASLLGGIASHSSTRVCVGFRTGISKRATSWWTWRATYRSPISVCQRRWWTADSASVSARPLWARRVGWLPRSWSRYPLWLLWKGSQWYRWRCVNVCWLGGRLTDNDNDGDGEYVGARL